MRWIFFLARRHLGSPLKRGVRLVMLLAGVGVGLGVATLTLTQAVSSGLEKAFLESILGFNAHLVVLKEGEMGDPQEEAVRIQEALKGQGIAFTPFLYREVLMVWKGRVKGAVLKGIDPLTFPKVYVVKVRPGIGSQVPANIGNLLQDPLQPEGTEEQLPRLVLGVDLAQALGLNGSGELVKVFIPVEDQKTGGRFQVFQVSGVFETGLHEFDEGFALGDLTQLQALFGVPGRATGIEWRLQDPSVAETLAAEMKENFRLPYDVISWQRLNGPLFRALRLERILFFVVMTMVVVVAAFNIVGVLLLMIFDKSREISILKAMGASERSLKRVFGLQGLALGTAGCLFGLVLGGGIAWILRTTQWIQPVKEVYLVDRLPVSFSPGMVFSVVGVSLLIAYLATQFGVARLKKTPLDL
jgi:lipoprotein-releasing system permease protein